MEVLSIPMWKGTGDNFAYVVWDNLSKDAVIIDPAHPSEVLPVLHQAVDKSGRGLILRKILNTHHHHDHSGGNKEISSEFPVPIVGGSAVNLVSHVPTDGEIIPLSPNISITCLYTPCHTRDSICYHVQYTPPPSHDTLPDSTFTSLLFTGDTLFTGGCGRFFEGTPAEMDRALNSTIATLPPHTRIYPGHDYALSNAKFALQILPHDPHFTGLHDFATRHAGAPPGSFTLEQEQRHNIFMRVAQPDVQAAAMKLSNTSPSPESTMLTLRQLKNTL